MPSLLSIAFRHLGSRRAQSALAILAVALGTGVAMAAATTSAAVEESLRQAALAVVGNADLVVEALDERGFTLDTVPRVQAIPGVRLVSPQVQKRVYFRTSEQRGFVQLVGVDPQLDPQVRLYRVARGRALAPSDGNTVLLVKGWAERVGLSPGSSLDLMTREGFKSFEVVGSLEETDLSHRTYGGLVRVPLATALSVFALGDLASLHTPGEDPESRPAGDARIHLLSLQLSNQAEAESVKRGLVRALNAPMVVRETPRILEELAGSMRDLQVALLFFAAVALLLGGLLCFNTLSLTVEDQMRQIGLLRAAGVLGRTIVLTSLAQGLFLGTMGAVAGVAVGQALATGLLLYLRSAQGLPAAAVPFPLLGALESFAVGLSMALIASFLPALRAGRITPLAALSAMQNEEGNREGRGRHEGVAAAGTVLIVAFIVAPIPGDTIRFLKVLSLLVLFPLFLRVTRALVPVLAPWAAAPVRRISRATGVMAQTSVRRDRNQANLTVAGFVISFSLVVALANGAASFSTAGQRWAESLFPGDFVVVSPVDQPTELLAAFKSIDGVEQASGISVVPVAWKGIQLTATGLDPSHYFPAFEFREGERLDAFTRIRRGGSVLVPYRLAQEHGVNVGDTLALRSAGGSGTFQVAGIIAHSLPTADNYGALVVSGRDAQGAFGVEAFRFATVSGSPGADLARLEEELARTAELYGMESNSVANLKMSIGEGVGGLLGLLSGFVGIGVVLGTLSAAVVMLTAVMQRQREIGILRTQGMTAGALRQLFVVEGAILGILGGCLGILLGAFLTWALVGLSRSPDFDPRFVFSAPLAGVALIGGLMIAVVAAWYPSRVAARISIVDALGSNTAN